MAEKIIRTTEPEITVLPRFIALRIYDVLRENNIPFEIIPQDDIPEGKVSGIATYRGKKYYRNVVGIKTCVDSEYLHDLAERMFHIDEYRRSQQEQEEQKKE